MIRRHTITYDFNTIIERIGKDALAVEMHAPTKTFNLAGLFVGVLWQDGRAFHGKYAICMNLALPFERVREAPERLDKYVFTV